MIVVTDSSPLIGFAKGDCFHLFKEFFGSLFISPEVKREVIDEGSGEAGEKELSRALNKWIFIKTPSVEIFQRIHGRLKLEDKSVLALAIEKKADWLIADDRKLRRYAERYKIRCAKTVEVLTVFKRFGIVSAVKPIMDKMRERKFEIDEKTYREILKKASEL